MHQPLCSLKGQLSLFRGTTWSVWNVCTRTLNRTWTRSSLRLATMWVRDTKVGDVIAKTTLFKGFWWQSLLITLTLLHISSSKALRKRIPPPSMQNPPKQFCYGHDCCTCKCVMAFYKCSCTLYENVKYSSESDLQYDHGVMPFKCITLLYHCLQAKYHHILQDHS